MRTRLDIARVAIVGWAFSSAFAMGENVEIAIRGLMSRTELARLECTYTEISTLKVKGPLKEDEQVKYDTCLAAIKEENQKRQKLFDLLKEGDNLADYPGLLEKVRISYDRTQFKEPATYVMFVFPSVPTSENTVFRLLRVDLRGDILKKVVNNTARD